MRPSRVIGPDGGVLTPSNLPLPGTERWVPRRKAEIVAGVRGGLITLEDACSRYALSAEEFLSWQIALERSGIRGLRATYRCENGAGRQDH